MDVLECRRDWGKVEELSFYCFGRPLQSRQPEARISGESRDFLNCLPILTTRSE